MAALAPPASDSTEGMLVRLPDSTHLGLFLNLKLAAEGWDVVHRGPLVLCYGFPYLVRPEDTLLPQWVFDDFRTQHHGADALTFMLDRGGAFPRADVAGRRVSTGQRDDRFFKEMDLAAALRAVAYRSQDDEVALGYVISVAWIEAGTGGLSQLDAEDERPTPWMRQAVACWRVGREYLADHPDLALAAMSG